MAQKPRFVVPLSLGTISAGNERSGNPASNLGEFSAIGLTWKSSGTANLWAKGDFGTPQEVNFAALVSANAENLTTYRLRLANSDADLTAAPIYDSGVRSIIDASAYPSSTPTLSLDFLSQAYSVLGPAAPVHSYLELASTVTARCWRIDIAGHSGDFEASSLVLGKSFQPSRFYNFDYERGIEDLGEMGWGRWMVPDETPGAIMRSVSFTLAWQSEAEFEASFRPMIERLGKRGIVYVCFDPEASQHRQSKTYMGVMRKPPFARGIRKPATYSQDFEILSII